MRVKICGIRNDDDLNAAISAGADSIGFLVGQIHPSPDFIIPATAYRLAQKVPPFITPIIVTHLIEASSILEILNKTQVFNVQLHGGSPWQEVAKLREKLPSSAKIVLAIHIIKGKPSVDVEPYLPYINAILIDSYNVHTKQVGGTGKTHDWVSSAEFTAKSKLPVILAGGLNPDNVGEAIKIVHPYGVDANSGLKDQNRNCSPLLCRLFVRNAKIAFFNLLPFPESSSLKPEKTETKTIIQEKSEDQSQPSTNTDQQ